MVVVVTSLSIGSWIPLQYSNYDLRNYLWELIKLYFKLYLLLHIYIYYVVSVNAYMDLI